MSGRLPNPLDNFSSYSTHFVMLACRTTEAARDFAQEAESTTLRAINDVSYLGEPVKWKESNDSVYLVLDTRRFSQFTVDKFYNETLINGFQAKGSHGNLSTEVKMTILDSVGISFINYMQWLIDERMQCNFDGIIFMLRVIFIGHNDDGRASEVVQTVTIPMHLFKMDVNLDYAKGVYECTFQPNFNFAVNVHNRWLNIGHATNYKTANAPKLGQMVENFQTVLNAESNNFYNSVQKQPAAGQVQGSETASKFGRKVQYMITIPEKWKDFTWTGASLDNAIERKFGKDKNKPEDPITPALNNFTSVAPGQTIPQVLDLMFEQVDQIKQLANADALNGGKSITFYKHLISISSDEDGFTVHVDVIPFVVPNVKPQSTNGNKDNSTTSKENFVPANTRGGSLQVPKNYFELDYIFTGKNTDILNFDMKIQDLQFLLAANVRVGEGRLFLDSQTDGQKDVVKSAGSSSNNTGPHNTLARREDFNTRRYDPILIPMLTKDQKADFSQYVAMRSEATQNSVVSNSLSYAQNLSTFYARSPVNVSLKIKGNPDIFDKFTLQTPVDHAVPNAAGTYRQKLEEDLLKLDGIARDDAAGTFSVKPLGNQSYVGGPVFAKINIKGPNVDPRTNELIDGNNFAESVLYNNYYIVMKVINTIEKGVFTQDLEMNSFNLFEKVE